MKRNVLSSLMTVMLFATTLFFISCKEDKDPEPLTGVLAQVSADDDLIVKLSADEFLTSAGCELNGTKIKLPAILREILDENLTYNQQNEIFEYYALVRECIDINQLYLVCEDVFEAMEYGRRVYIYTLVNDTKKLDEILCEEIGLMCSNQDGYKVYSAEGEDVIIVDGDILFAGASRNLTKDYARRVENAAKAPLSGAGVEIVNAFESGTTLVAYLSMDNLYDVVYEAASRQEQEMYDMQRELLSYDLFACKALITAKFDKSSFELDFAYYQDGERVQVLPNGANIDTGLLEYLSEEQIFVFATTALADIDFSKIIKNMPEYQYASASDRTMMNIVAEYLNKIDGELIIAAGPRYNYTSTYTNPSLDDWSITALVKMEDGVAEELFDLLYDQLENNYVEVEKQGNNLIIYSYDVGVPVYVGVRENCLIVSLDPIEYASGCAYENSYFVGKNTLLLGELKEGSALLNEIGIEDMGTMVEFSNDNSTGKVVWSIDNGNKYFVESLLEAVKQIAEYEQSQYDYYSDYYDYDYDYDYDPASTYEDDYYDQFIEAAAEDYYYY